MDEESSNWTGQDLARYEAALEAISSAMAAYSALIAAEEKKSNPDFEAIARAQNGRRECIKRREQLNPRDLEEVTHVRRRYNEIAQEVHESMHE